MEYSGIFHQYSKHTTEKIVPQQKYDKFGIWNIPKKLYHNENMKILEYGIFHGIFLEYSKKSITTRGGVKFNQVGK